MNKDYPRPLQITRWLHRQDWFKEFLNHVIHERSASFLQKVRRLLGLYGEDTIQGAFVFDVTLEGQRYWNKVNDSFIDWYYGYGKDE